MFFKIEIKDVWTESRRRMVAAELSVLLVDGLVWFGSVKQKQFI